MTPAARTPSEVAAPATSHFPTATESRPRPAAAGRPKPSRLWLWFVLAFVVQVAAWTAWFVIASRHKVEEVPLAGATIHKR